MIRNGLSVATGPDSWEYLHVRFADSCASTMTTKIDHADLDSALRRCGSTWGGAQAHGLLCGRLAIQGGDGAMVWRDQLLESLDPADALRAECEILLDEVFQQTWRQLAERQSELELLLPDDGETPASRAQCLAEWCEGFLHGLVSENHNDAVRQRLGTEPLSDLIRDMLEITRATAGDDDEETEESAYVELVEYIRVAAQLAYEELAETRSAPLGPTVAGGPPDTLH